jgi:hypothetical protein
MRELACVSDLCGMDGSCAVERARTGAEVSRARWQREQPAFLPRLDVPNDGRLIGGWRGVTAGFKRENLALPRRRGSSRTAAYS